MDGASKISAHSFSVLNKRSLYVSESSLLHFNKTDYTQAHFLIMAFIDTITTQTGECNKATTTANKR